MRIATWNVNSVRARLERLLPWLEDCAPDVVCLQETKCQDHQFPREPIEELGYQIAALGQKTYNGVAILSRHPLEDVSTGFGIERFDGEARVIGATIRDVMVLNVYVVNGREVGCEKYDYKLEWLAALREHLVEAYPMDEKVLVTGDFNITFDDRDVWDPKRWHGKILCSTPEREALAALVATGLHDSLRKFTEESGHFTWWDFRTRSFEKGNRGLRIDHFLLSSPALEACTAHEVDLDARAGKKPSDHAPVIVTLE